MTEADVFRVFTRTSSNEAVVVANGFLSRHAFQCGDATTNFYMLGSMGLALSIGLGVALAQPLRRVVVIDGDGNLLMSLGALAMAGHIAPRNLMAPYAGLIRATDGNFYGTTLIGGGGGTVFRLVLVRGCIVCAAAEYSTAQPRRAGQTM